MQLYGIEKSFQQPQDMWTTLESPDIKERYFPNLKWSRISKQEAIVLACSFLNKYWKNIVVG